MSPLDAMMADMRSRLDAVEAAAKANTKDPEVVWARYEALRDGRDPDEAEAAFLAKDAPATVEDTVAAGETIQPGDPRPHGPNDYRPSLRDREYGQDLIDAKAKADARDAAEKAARDGLKDGLGVDDLVAKVNAEFKSKTVEAAGQSAETMPDQPFKMTILDRASIVFTKDGREAMLVEDFQRFVGNHMKRHSVDLATIQDREETVAALMGENAELFDQSDRDADTIATLQTEIATRDRLLDDQCATIGKLEAERDGAKAKLDMVLSRVDGMDLNNPDKMRGQRWVQDTGKNQTQVVCTWAGHDVLVSRSIEPVFLARLRETLAWEGKK